MSLLSLRLLWRALHTSTFIPRNSARQASALTLFLAPKGLCKSGSLRGGRSCAEEALVAQVPWLQTGGAVQA
ncbi:hypothetical protein GcM3_c146o64 [Golovinomyces cichoracearum]|uniref:Uncharacterized protein n=1 Tax=Golovinomyces cichoracearum TaxID=62708 RepID=A0A420J3D9_9PEZI|nr:hypothetical protein GcM3_c146o64 [Golovinomyces cichoracearum]